MRRCDTVEEVGTNFDLVKAEAKKAFGNDDIFMEKFLVELDQRMYAEKRAFHAARDGHAVPEQGNAPSI